MSARANSGSPSLPQPSAILIQPRRERLVGTAARHRTGGFLCARESRFCVVEKTVSLTNLMLDAMQMIRPDSLKIAKEPKMIVRAPSAWPVASQIQFRELFSITWKTRVL